MPDKATIRQLELQTQELRKKVENLSNAPVTNTSDAQFKTLQTKCAALEKECNGLRERCSSQTTGAAPAKGALEQVAALEQLGDTLLTRDWVRDESKTPQKLPKHVVVKPKPTRPASAPKRGNAFGI